MSELKPCPFCGAEAIVEVHGGVKIVGCSKLSMLCPNPRMTVYDNDFSHWNKRATDDTITEKEKAISELIDKIQLNTEILKAIMERGHLQASDYHAIICAIKNNQLLITKHKQSKGE